MRATDAELWLPVALACAAAPVQATQYLTLAQAQRALFPRAEAFVDTAVPRAWAAIRGAAVIGHIMVDDVVGKHELITYAVGIDAEGVVRGVEILDYREARGGEVRDPRWRAQFVGKRHGAPLVLDQDIQNTSGATLSCRHLAEGVRRLLAVHASRLKRR